MASLLFSFTLKKSSRDRTIPRGQVTFQMIHAAQNWTATTIFILSFLLLLLSSVWAIYERKWFSLRNAKNRILTR